MKATTILLAAVLILPGCAGRTANPVMIEQYGDTTKSCTDLKVEIATIESQMSALAPKTSKTAKNVALGVTGAVVFAPALFFMDFKQGEKKEYEAFYQRRARLLAIAEARPCKDLQVTPEVAES